MSDAGPIGIFDSGIGGLTVLATLIDRFPGESFIYLGDTARLPYGTKSAETVQRYAAKAATALLQRRVKLLVVACNTASALALPALRRQLPIPVLGVVGPGARTAARVSRGRIGVIGTESTIGSSSYVKALHELRPELEVTTRACPLFVPLAEEGWFDHPVTSEVARLYLEPMRTSGIDTLILGCTHYPLLRRPIAAAVGTGVTLVDSAEAIAAEVGDVLRRHELGAGTDGGGALRLLVTDAAARFERIAELILGALPVGLELVDLPD